MIDKLLELQKPVMIFFASLRTPLLTSFSEAVSFLGEATWLVALILFIYFVIDKKKGFALALVTMTGHIANNTLKAIFRIPRPWVKYPDEIIPLRENTATGYSFPSGHSVGAGVFYWSLYKLFDNKCSRVPSIILLVLIPLSRIYLGVHWPLDILFGLALGVFIASFISNFLNLYDDDERLKRLTLIAVPVALFIAFLDSAFIDMGYLDETLYKDIASSFVGWGAIILASFLEKKYVNFKIEGKVTKRVLFFLLSFALGYASTLLWLGNMRTMHRTNKTLGLLLLIMWEIFLWPLIAVKLKIFSREENH